jgi:hypothetical protein
MKGCNPVGWGKNTRDHSPSKTCIRQTKQSYISYNPWRYSSDEPWSYQICHISNIIYHIMYNITYITSKSTLKYSLPHFTEFIHLARQHVI